ncbi:MAG TPA: amidase [Chloroflexota bacterium]|nr:amidase [Chloroflexota bacterium]
MTEPYNLTASEAARAIANGTLGAGELLGSLLERIRLAEPAVAAWEHRDEAGALAAANRFDAAGARQTGLSLGGVPIGIKDIYDIRGLPTRCGFGPWADRRADADATTVARARAAGAVFLGKTVTTQFAFADPPKTTNPWNPERTPGGSSSGSAAAVAARMVPLALGSQTAGSILRPAAYCGVLGLKPTYGRISRQGIFPLAWSLDHPGPIARSVEDLALALSVLAGRDPTDPTTAAPRPGDYRAAVQSRIEPPAFGVMTDFFQAAEPPVAETVNEAVNTLTRAGARRVDRRLTTPLRTVAAAQQVIMQVEAAEIHAQLHAELPEAYAPRMRALVEIGQAVPAHLYLRAQRVRRQFRREMAEVIGTVDCLLMPTVSNLAPGRETTGDRTFQAPWSLVGWPTLTLPAGLAAGLPTGLQLVAGPWQEERLLAIARWAEQRLPPIPSPV